MSEVFEFYLKLCCYARFMGRAWALWALWEGLIGYEG